MVSPFNWKAALMIVKPETLIGWHSKGFKGFKLFWRWRSRLGRPRIPEVLRQLTMIAQLQEKSWSKLLTLVLPSKQLGRLSRVAALY
jgi:putative transposase